MKFDISDIEYLNMVTAMLRYSENMISGNNYLFTEEQEDAIRSLKTDEWFKFLMSTDIDFYNPNNLDFEWTKISTETF